MKKHQNNVWNLFKVNSNFVLMSLSLNSNLLHTFVYCLYWWIWRGKWLLSWVETAYEQIVENCIHFKLNSCLLNSFVPIAPLLYLQKSSENLTVFWCFQGVEKGCIGNDELIRKIYRKLWEKIAYITLINISFCWPISFSLNKTYPPKLW